MTEQVLRDLLRVHGGIGAETPILTHRGERRAADLKPGDKVQTFNHGPQVILGTAHWEVSLPDLLRDPDLRPLALTSPAIDCDTITRFGHGHRLLLPDVSLFSAQKLMTSDQLQRLGHARDELRRGGMRFVHLLMAHHALVLAGGLWSETLCLDRKGHTCLHNCDVTLAPRLDIDEIWHDDPCMPTLSDAEANEVLAPMRMPKTAHAAKLVRIA